MAPDAPYQFEVAPAVERELDQLPEGVATACVELIASVLICNPYRASKELVREPLIGLRSARRGEYRVIFWIDDDDAMLKIVRVSHRSRAYRNRPAGA